MKVYIWGTGVMASDYISKQEIAESELLGFIETRRTKEYFAGKKVYEPQEITEKYDYIIVCVRNAGREICQVCKRMGIDTGRLILMDNWEWLDGSSINQLPPQCCKKIVDNGTDISRLFPIFYDSYLKEPEIQAGRYTVISRNGFDLCEPDAPILSGEFHTLHYQTDYYRYRTFELTANEIIKKKIRGCVAEVGVFQGMFSRLINKKFMDRTLYLFDTFESFHSGEFQEELEAGRVPETFLENFKNTTIRQVIDSMPYPDRCVVRKGLFPETAKGLENEEYAFVSIDVDFEKSILEGLRYFYPRLNQGGAVFVHDYNNRFLEGVKKAVDTYETEYGKPLPKVPLADEGGTLVLLK